MEPVRLGFIGFGYWGKNLLRSFQFLKESQIYFGCDLEEKNLEFLRNLSPACKTTKNFSELLNDSQVEGVVIATPSPSHFALVKSSLQAGKHVFVEKPIAMTVAEAEELVALAKKQQRILMVGHLLKHHPVCQYLKKQIDEGNFGEIYYIYTQRLNLGIIRNDENPLWTLSPHDLSLILHYFDETPHKVQATGASFLQKNIEDVIFASLQFKSGKVANLHLSWLDPHKIRKLTIVGSKKMAVFDDMEPREKLKIYDKSAQISNYQGNLLEHLMVRDGDIYIPKLDLEEPLRLECRNFIHAIRGKEKIKSDGPEAVQILKVITKLDESLKQKGKVVEV